MVGFVDIIIELNEKIKQLEYLLLNFKGDDVTYDIVNLQKLNDVIYDVELVFFNLLKKTIENPFFLLIENKTPYKDINLITIKVDELQEKTKIAFNESKKNKGQVSA